jgi:hypothetical protein
MVLRRLFNHGQDNLLGWFEKHDGMVWYGTWRNMGDGRFDKIGDTNVADDCIQAGVNFIIIINGMFNGQPRCFSLSLSLLWRKGANAIIADGLDDFICIAKDGAAYALINQGDGSGTRPPSFY